MFMLYASWRLTTITFILIPVIMAISKVCMRVCVCVHVYVRVHVCVRVRVRASVCVCVHMCGRVGGNYL
jgi:hypothetical protein